MSKFGEWTDAQLEKPPYGAVVICAYSVPYGPIDMVVSGRNVPMQYRTGQVIASWDSKWRRWLEETYNGTCCTWFGEPAITHWMPRPEPPEQVQT